VGGVAEPERRPGVGCTLQDVGSAADAQAGQVLIPDIADSIQRRAAWTGYRRDIVEATIEHPAPGLIVSPIVGALDIARQRLIAPDSVGREIERAERMENPVGARARVEPNPGFVRPALDGAVDKVELSARARRAPSCTGKDRLRGRGPERSARPDSQGDVVHV